MGCVAFVAAASPGRAGAETSPSYTFSPNASGALTGRVFTAAAGDTDGSSVVLYGGERPGNASDKMFGDTWVYTAATGWVAKCGSTAAGATAPCGPGKRSTAAMAAGPNGPILFGGTPTGRVFPGLGGNGTQAVLFGGLTSGGLADDTWVFDGHSWTQTCGTGVPTACGVPGRLGATIGWDGHEFVMFGGAPQGGSDIGAPTDDTWTFDGTAWTQVCGTSVGRPCGPGPRALAGMALQRQTKATLQGAVLAGGGSLFGGGAQSLDRDAWLFRAGTWTQLSTPWSASEVHFTDGDQPPVGSGPLLPFVVARPAECQVLFVGQNPIRDPDFAVTPQTYSGGWDRAGTGRPADCTTDPAGTPVTVPVGETAAVPAATPPGAPGVLPLASGPTPSTPVTASMARTGTSSGPLAAAGALAIVLGLAAILGARSKRAPATARFLR